MKTRFFAMAFMASILACTAIEKAWAQHEGHGGMDMPAGTPMSPEAAAKEAREERTRKLTKLEEKIEALDTELERDDLKPGKRKKLEAKRKKLLDKKDELLGYGQIPETAGFGGHEHHH